MAPTLTDGRVESLNGGGAAAEVPPAKFSNNCAELIS